MNAKELPARPSLEHYKKQAKDLLKSCKSGDSGAVQRVKSHHPRFSKLPDSGTLPGVALADVQFAIAREHGFESWPKFAKEIERLNTQTFVAGIGDPVAAFIQAACVPFDGSSHASGNLDRAEAILAAHPGIAGENMFAAAILGDDAGVRRFLALDAKNATRQGGPYGWDALTYLCFSRYLRLDRTRSGGFVGAARALLDAGANPNGGWFEKEHQPEPVWESVLYGAAGVAHHAELTRLLLERGADPNDGETPYHTPESYDNEALKVLVESGKLSEPNLAMMLVRKTDWHDYEGIKWMLECGVDPNSRVPSASTALHHAVLRDNSTKVFELLLDHGADPTLSASSARYWGPVSPQRTGVALAARRGRSDLLELFEKRGFAVELDGVDSLIAACARNDSQGVRAIVEQEPHLVGELLKSGGTLLAEFAGVGNEPGMRQLLDLGVDAGALFGERDPYFDITETSTPLHVAAWRARPAAVKLLIERGAPVNALDGKDRSALALAVRACVDSYWTNRRTPESVQALLEAKSSVEGVKFPSGYAEVDDLLRRHGMKE